MNQYRDENGLEFTASSDASVAMFSTLTRSYLGFRRDIGSILKELLGNDPDMPMAVCAKGYFAKLMASALHSQRALKTSQQLDEVINTHASNSAGANTCCCPFRLVPRSNR